MTLQALRDVVGDATFFRILRDWYAEHRYGNVTTAQFIALAQRESHRDLRAFFQAWLYGTAKPPAPPGTSAPARAQLQSLAARPHGRR
jgi:aminopeptidase N